MTNEEEMKAREELQALVNGLRSTTPLGRVNHSKIDATLAGLDSRGWQLSKKQ